jgi:hypothetical protein
MSPFARRKIENVFWDQPSPEEASRKERERGEWLRALEEQVEEKKRSKQKEEEIKRKIDEKVWGTVLPSMMISNR